jgi:ankyrin repeat protein
MNMWYCALNGQSQGPYSEQTLRGMVANGELTPETPVWNVDLPGKGWEKASGSGIAVLFTDGSAQSLQGKTNGSTSQQQEIETPFQELKQAQQHKNANMRDGSPILLLSEGHENTYMITKRRTRLPFYTGIAFISILVVGMIVLMVTHLMPILMPMSDDDFLNLCVAGTPSEVEAAIKKGANIKAKDANDNTALMLAVRDGKSDVIKILIENGIEVNAKNIEGMTALAFAVGNGELDMIKILVENGAKVNAKSTDATTALMLAINEDRPEIIETLVKNGVDANEFVESGGVTLLMRASSLGKLNAIKTLIENGADVNAKSPDGFTVLYFAKEARIKEVLVSHGAEPPIGDEDFLKLCAKGTSGDVEMAIKNGANVNAKNDTGVTALMNACNNPDVMTTLIKNGADVNMKAAGLMLDGSQGQMGLTALMWVALAGNNPKAIDVLVENGADVNARNPDGVTALMLAAGNNN